MNRLGVGADADPETVLSALDDLLARAARPALPEEAEVIDRATLADLRAEAEVGRNSRHRDLINSAIRTGKIPVSSRSTWETLLSVDPNAEQTLASLKANTIPVTSLGHSGDGVDSDDRDPLLAMFDDPT